jgi:hypothetical protein
MKSKISNRNLFKGGNIDIFTSLNVKEDDITNSYISSIDLKSDGFMFNQSYINTYYLHLAIFCYYYENSTANRAEYITAKVDKIKEYVKYFVLYQILNKIMTDDDEGKYLNAIKSMDDFDATQITFDEKENGFVKIKKILNATAFIIKYTQLIPTIKTQLKDYNYTPEKIKTLNELITKANENKGKNDIPKPPPTGQDKELEKIKQELNNFDISDVSSFKIFDVTTKAVEFIKKINDTSGTDKVQLIIDNVISQGADINDLQQAYEGLLDDDKSKVKEIGDILSGEINRDAAQAFYNRFNDEYIKREILLKFNFDAFSNPVTGGAIGEIDSSYLEIVDSKFGTIKNATGTDIYNLTDLQPPYFELYKHKAQAGLDIINKKIDIINYPDKNDLIYNIYLFYNSYIKICDFLKNKNVDKVDELKNTASESLNFIKNILTHIGNIRNQDISKIADEYIDDLKSRISPTTTDDFLQKIPNNNLTQEVFNAEKGTLLSQKQDPPQDKLLIYDFLVKLNKDDSLIKADIVDVIQDDSFKLNAYKYLLMKSTIEKGEDVSFIIAENDVNKIIQKLEPSQTGGATDKPNNIFNAYMIMVMNKIMEMDKDGLDNFNKNLKSIEA